MVASQLVPYTNSYHVNSYPSQRPVQVNLSTPELQSLLEIYLKANNCNTETLTLTLRIAEGSDMGTSWLGTSWYWVWVDWIPYTH